MDKKIVFFGDSITAAFNLENYFDETNLVNAGIGGDSTIELLNRISDVLKHNIDKLFLLIGTNDINNQLSDEEILNNINKIVTLILDAQPNAKLFIESCIIVNDSDDKKIFKEYMVLRNNPRIRGLNKRISDYCENKGLTYIELNTSLEDEFGKLKLENTVEGLHLTDVGYKKISSVIRKYM